MNLDKRQKIMVGLVVFALIILIWQVRNLVADDGESTSKQMPSQQLTKPNLNQSSAPALRNAANTTVAVNNNAQMNALTPDQQKYLTLVNEYQMAEIQRMIAEDQAAIAKARADTANSMSEIAKLGGNANDLNSALTNTNQQATDPTQYALIYTGEDNGEWTATLRKNGQYNDVTAGSMLPDGAKVLSVDENGVLIQQDTKKILVTFNGVLPFNNTNDNANAAINAIPQSKAQPKATSQPVPVPAVTAKKPVVITKPVVVPVEKTTEKSIETKTTTTTTVKNTEPVTKNNNVDNDNLAFLTFKKNTYTIQVIADEDSATVHQFMAANNLQNQGYVVKITRSHHKPWHIGVYGEYNTINEATQALNQLPKAARSADAFVVRVGSIQSKIADTK